MSEVYEKIYLDYAATTPICDEALLSMSRYIDISKDPSSRFCANANTLYTLGRDSFNVLENSRREVAKLAGANRPSEIVFCANATESVFLSLVGIAEASDMKTIVTTPLEHSCVINTAKYIAGSSSDIVYVEPNSAGEILPEKLDEVLSKETPAIVSIQMANSEIGTIQRIAELAEVAHKHNCYFHTDMTQAVGKVPFNLSDMGVDAASFSSHKITGPVGVGIMYVKANTPFKTPLKGGNQENGMRGGTQNVVAVAGFTAAFKWAIENASFENERLSALRNKIYNAIRENDEFSDINITLDPAKHTEVQFLPNVAHICLNGTESETSVLRFDEAGICVSGGSACSSHSLEPSRSLSAIGVDKDRALCALRISFGRWSTEADIDKFLDVLREVK